MNPLTNLEPGKKTQPNYWGIDNQLSFIGVFKALYESDKSKKKVNSSQLLWAVALYCHPDSRLINFPSAEKRQIIEADYLGKELDWDKIEALTTEYKKLYLTQARRSLENWKLKLEERDEYLNSFPYKSLDLEDAKLLDTLLANTPKLYKQYDEIQEQILDEDAKAINKAGIQESAAERKLI